MYNVLFRYYIACGASEKFLILYAFCAFHSFFFHTPSVMGVTNPRSYALIKLRMVPGKSIIFVNSIETCYQVTAVALEKKLRVMQLHR